MIKKMSVFVGLCSLALHAEQIIYLDQEKVEDAVAEIMRGHGIQSHVRRHVLEAECTRRILRSMVAHSDALDDGDEPTLDFEEVV